MKPIVALLLWALACACVAATVAPAGSPFTNVTITGGTITGIAQFRMPNGSALEYGENAWVSNNYVMRTVQNGGTVRNLGLDVASTAGSIVFQTAGTTRSFVTTTAFVTNGAVMVGSNTALTLTAGAVGMQKITASGTAPGAAGLKLEVVCGTNAGTAKITAIAGTSSTPVTVLDNIGSGVTGC